MYAFIIEYKCIFKMLVKYTSNDRELIKSSDNMPKGNKCEFWGRPTKNETRLVQHRYFRGGGGGVSLSSCQSFFVSFGNLGECN